MVDLFDPRWQWRDLERYADAPDRLSIGVSGGRSSAYQALHIVRANGGVIKPGWAFNFENTGLELDETYLFLAQVNAMLGGVLAFLEFDSAAPTLHRRVAFAELNRNGGPMTDLLSQVVAKRRDGSAGVRPLPNAVQRTCTANLKVKTAHRYLRRSLNWPSVYHAAIGYRADEAGRHDRRVAQEAKKRGRGIEGGYGFFPMFHAGVTSDGVQSFWQSAPFDLGIDSAHGNCDLCFMVSTWKIKERMLFFAMAEGVRPAVGGPIPLRVARWIAWEERASDRPGTFRKNRPPVRQLWHSVCVGFMDSEVPEGVDDRCVACSD